MTPFPQRPEDFRLFAAVRDHDGGDRFIEPQRPAVAEQAGVFEAAWFWAVTGEHMLGAPGAPATAVKVAGPGGSTLGILRFPANSAGKLNVASRAGSEEIKRVRGDPSMHATRTIDYEIILAGKVDFVLPDGDSRTLGPGDMIVVAGATHAWRNSYDEDCLYVAITIGTSD